MQALRKNLCWTFAITSIICSWIVVEYSQRGIDRFQASPSLSVLLIPALFAVLAIVFGLAWWTIWKGRSSARSWGIAASLVNVLVSLFPIVLSSHSVWRCSGVTLPIGIAGLIAYSRRYEWSHLASIGGEAAHAPFRRVSLRTVAVILAGAAVICGVASSWLLYKQKAIERQLTEAATACRANAERGDVAAQSSLGSKYLRGQGVRQDYFEAVRWYRKAADQGFSKGEYNLGYVYAHGYGVSQDYVQAARWYRKAAEQGDAHAQYNLGLLYLYGQGEPQDSTEAERWFLKAADQSDTYAKQALRKEHMRPSPWDKMKPWVSLVVGLWLSAGSSKKVWGFENWRKSVAPISAGILLILYSGLSFLELFNISLPSSVLGANAFYLVKGLLIGFTAVVVLSMSPKQEGLKESQTSDCEVE